MSTPNTPVIREDWMSPLNKIIWLKAFRAKQTEVTIRDGRRFRLDYDRIPGKVWVSFDGAAFHPCGWFDLKKVTNQLWLQDT